MKPPTSLQATPSLRKRVRPLHAVPDGVPTGVIYSYTSGPSSPDLLVLVKLTGGPMVMGSLPVAQGQNLNIGTRVRMAFPVDDPEAIPVNGRNSFELLRPAASDLRTSQTVLQATAA